MSKLRVAVVYGGRSGEHEISLRSAKSVLAALDREKYEVSEFVISKDGKWQPRPISPEPGGNPAIDVVFPVLHGTFGEDGTIQGLFEMAELPYVSAGVLASAVSMDKEVMKRLCRERDLPVVEYLMLTRDTADIEAIASRLQFPVFVKPANLGSSVGISKAHTKAELKTALETAASWDQKVIVERGIEGREFECSVMGNGDPVAATPCEILPSREFYDYEDKYLLDKAKIELPARLSPEQTEHMRWLAVQCYRAVGCEVMARVDFLMERATGQIFINEINTIPGFTSISMFPKMWEHTGISYAELLDRLIEFAVERAESRRQTRYSR
jgi:D-alanine-D-alanine ligase